MIAHDSTTEDKTSASGASSLTYSHTVSGSDRFLYVAITTINRSVGNVTNVTFNGVSLTELLGDVLVFNTTNWYHHGWYLINPPAGTYNIVITSTPGSGNNTIRSGCVSYTGVDQTSPILDSNSASSLTGNNMQIPLTIASAGWAIISGANVDASFVAGSNTDTLRASYSGLADIADSGNDIAASTFNAQMTHSGSRGYGGIAFGLLPNGGGGGYRFNPQLKPFVGL